MARVIQFPCPACHTMLSIPLEAANQRGPCPRCGSDLIAPDPFLGTPAQLVPPEVTFAAPLASERSQPPTRFQDIPPFRPDPPPDVKRSQVPSTAAPVSQPDHPAPVPETSPPTKSALPSALGIGALAAILGFAGGYQSARSAHPSNAAPKPASAASVSPNHQTSTQPTAKEESAPPRSPAAAKHPDHVLSAPKDALQAFLAAKDWKSRGAFVLFPDYVLKRMESYHATHPDGPTEAIRLNVEHCESDPSSELLLVIIRVTTAACPAGFTVAVQETPDGWKTDWETFIEFKDMLFDLFTAGKNGDVGKFHLVVQASTAPAGLENSISYTLTDPVKGTEHQAYAIKGGAAATTLASLTRDKALCTPALELERHTRPDGSATLEIRSVATSNWRPQRPD